MANCMAGVAKLLGVEVGEVFEFYVGGECQGRCRFTKDRVEVSDNHCWYRTKAETLEWLLDGTATIVKLPWKPGEGEGYYVPAIDNESGCYYGIWENNNDEKRQYHRGLVFKTRDEATALAEKMLAVAKEVEANG